MAKDYPIEELAKEMERLVAEGSDVYFKWTCEGCGERCSANEPNQITLFCKHEECGHITDVRKTGGNYLVVASGAAAVKVLKDLAKGEPGE